MMTISGKGFEVSGEPLIHSYADTLGLLDVVE